MENQNTLFAAYSFIPTTFIGSPQVFYGVMEQMSMQIYHQNQQISQLKKENQDLKTLIKQSQTQKTSLQPGSDQNNVVNHSENCQTKEKPQRTYYCEYDNCDRVYASTLALNLHIKTKHNGGTKKQRDAYAKLIALAQIKGLPRPEINFIFPKNYIQNFKQKLLEQQNIIKN